MRPSGGGLLRGAFTGLARVNLGPVKRQHKLAIGLRYLL